MSYKSLLTQLKTLLNDNGFQRKVSIYDYSILDLAIDPCIVLRPGPLTEGISAYGGEHAYVYNMLAEVFAYYTPEGSAQTANTLIEAIDDVNEILRDNVFLGLDISQVESARVAGVTAPALVPRAMGTTNRLYATMTVQIVEPISESASAQ